jgi:hypothetical protein
MFQRSFSIKDVKNKLIVYSLFFFQLILNRTHIFFNNGACMRANIGDSLILVVWVDSQILT